MPQAPVTCPVAGRNRFIHFPLKAGSAQSPEKAMLVRHEPDTRKQGSSSSHTASAANTPQMRPHLPRASQDQAPAPRSFGEAPALRLKG